MLTTVRDIEICELRDRIEAAVLDFEGLNEDWEEIERDYDEEAVS